MGLEKDSTITLFVFLLVALAGMYAISTQARVGDVYISPQPSENTVTVNGEAKTKATPNLAQISFTVETNDTQSAQATQERNAQITADIKAALLAAGVLEKDIETTQFLVTPVKVSRWDCPVPRDIAPDVAYDCNPYDRTYYDEVIGYKTTHRIFVKTENTENAGELLDIITRGRGNEVRVDSVSFGLKDETKRQLEASLLERAAQDAKARAEKIAAGSGSSLGRLKSASENVYYPYYYDNYLARDVAAESAPAPSTDVSPGQVDVTARVTVNYEVR